MNRQAEFVWWCRHQYRMEPDYRGITEMLPCVIAVIAKAKGLAKCAEAKPQIEKVQLIRMEKMLWQEQI